MRVFRNVKPVLQKTCSFSTISTSNFVLTYKYIPSIVDARSPFRSAHLTLAKSYLLSGTLVAAGPFQPASLGAQFIFRNTTEKDVEDFVKLDPYVKNNLVTEYDIKEWNIVIGNIVH